MDMIEDGIRVFVANIDNKSKKLDLYMGIKERDSVKKFAEERGILGEDSKGLKYEGLEAVNIKGKVDSKGVFSYEKFSKSIYVDVINHQSKVYDGNDSEKFYKQIFSALEQMGVKMMNIHNKDTIITKLKDLFETVYNAYIHLPLTSKKC